MLWQVVYGILTNHNALNAFGHHNTKYNNTVKLFITKEITLNGTGMSSYALRNIVPLKYTFNILIFCTI